MWVSNTYGLMTDWLYVVMLTHHTQAYMLVLYLLVYLVEKGASLLDNCISFCYKFIWLCHMLRLLALVCLHAILWRGPWYILSVYIRIYCILHSPPCIRVDGCYSVYGVTLRRLYVSGDGIAVIMPNAIIAEILMRHLFKIINMCLRRIHDKKNSLRDLILHPRRYAHAA